MSETASQTPTAPPPRLLEKYRDQVHGTLMEKFKYANPMQVPRLQKITLNMGIGAGSQDNKLFDQHLHELSIITGQKPVLTLAKKAISTFKLRAGMPVGTKVTLRGKRMYEFLDRLVNVAMPRIRDFRGLNPRKGFDQGGNFSMGLTEQLIFPEVEFDKVQRVQGMDVTFTTTANTKEESLELLRQLGMPFQTSESE